MKVNSQSHILSVLIPRGQFPMNRFFCTVCGKMKRVQHYPSNVANVESETPSLRRGACNWHTPGYIVRPAKVRVIQQQAIPVPVQSQRRKKGGK